MTNGGEPANCPDVLTSESPLRKGAGTVFPQRGGEAAACLRNCRRIQKAIDIGTAGPDHFAEKHVAPFDTANSQEAVSKRGQTLWQARRGSDPVLEPREVKSVAIAATLVCTLSVKRFK